MCRRFSAPPASRHRLQLTAACPTWPESGTAAAFADALAALASGEDKHTLDVIDHASPGPVETPWGMGFRSYDECLYHIRQGGITAAEGGVALPLNYTVHERSTYSIVPSHAVWRDRARADLAQKVRRNEEYNHRLTLYFPQVLRDARRLGEYYPGRSPYSPEAMDRLGLSLAHRDLVYNHDVFNKDYAGDRTEDQGAKNPGVNAWFVPAYFSRPPSISLSIEASMPGMPAMPACRHDSKAFVDATLSIK
jgi:hypothetical protein